MIPKPSFLAFACAVFGLSLAPLDPVISATLGSAQTVSFGSATLEDYCNLNVTSGQLGYTSDFSSIGSTNFYANVEGKTFLGNQQSAQVTATTNLTTVKLIAESPTLTGPTQPESVALRFGTLQSIGSPGGVTPITQDATTGTPIILDVAFFASNSQTPKSFAEGTYTSTVSVTCTDDGTK